MATLKGKNLHSGEQILSFKVSFKGEQILSFKVSLKGSPIVEGIHFSWKHINVKIMYLPCKNECQTIHLKVYGYFTWETTLAFSFCLPSQ